MIKLFEVGGHVRDSLLGIKSKDIDMAVEAPSWEAMREFVIANTQKVFLEKPEFLTIRALGHDGLPKDFVLCRKDGAYSDGRRPDAVEPGTILDDLSRRDFTVNAIARDTETGELFDPFNGAVDLKARRLRCVGTAVDRFGEDSLRIIRAFRFWVTKDLIPDSDIIAIFQDPHWAESLQAVSTERIMEEMKKCFSHSTPKTLHLLGQLDSHLIHEIFAHELWLKPTMESR